MLNSIKGCNGADIKTTSTNNVRQLFNRIEKCLIHFVFHVKGAAGTRIKATINSMDLPFSSLYNCYHWIEFRDNLIGQAGKE